MIRNMVCFLILLIGFTQCISKADVSTTREEKIDGISLVASRQLIDSTNLVPVFNIGAEWVALMPYGFIRKEEGTVRYNSDRQWEGERVEGIEKDIETCRKEGLKIMLKPHVWVSKGGYTGDYEPGDIGWEPLESSYTAYITEFAHVAEDCHVELFCIGTEWRKFIKERPEFWLELIKKVRAIYSGKLTYAANWDEYEETPFWGQLDYIGVNAYFPLSEKEAPTVEELKQSWQPITVKLAGMSKQTGKPILFTEYGYRSVEGTTIKPWESYTELPESLEAQKRALDCLYGSVWEQDWMAGGFLWKWFVTKERWERHENTGYSPQKKPAEAVVKHWYRVN